VNTLRLGYKKQLHIYL